MLKIFTVKEIVKATNSIFENGEPKVSDWKKKNIDIDVEIKKIFIKKTQILE
tara:strand:- start:827 stop:982 length:156 start_codon:yes stop_codon:yes gene_type:complete